MGKVAFSLYSLNFSPQYEPAINYYQEFLNTAREHKIYGAETQALAYMSLVYLVKGDYNSSIDYGQQTKAITQKNQDYYSEYVALLNQAIAHAYLNDCAKSNLLYNQSLSVVKNLNESAKETVLSKIAPAFVRIKLDACLSKPLSSSNTKISFTSSHSPVPKFPIPHCRLTTSSC